MMLVLRCLTILFACLLAGAAPAQPWSLYDGDFYNPTGFPQPSWDLGIEYPTEAVGDFNGDGRDDFFLLQPNAYILAMPDTARPGLWNSVQGLQNLGEATGTWAHDFDGDGAEELLFFAGDSQHVWKAVTPDAASWERRDDLLGEYALPFPAIKAVYGDYDGDGLPEAVCQTNDQRVVYYERRAEGYWQFQSEFCNGFSPFISVFDGDFDGDGDLDFGISPEFGGDIPPCGHYGESTPEGLVLHELGFAQAPRAVTGGDLDNDGAWEALAFAPYAAGYSFVEMVPCSTTFVCVAGSRYVGPGPAPVLATFTTPAGPQVVSVNSYRWGAPFYVNGAFFLLARTDSGWRNFDNGFDDAMGWGCAGGSLGDLNGDGLREILSVLVHYGVGGEESYVLRIWPNTGDSTEDHYGRPFDFSVEPAGSWPMTRERFPQLGDITGDGRAEIVTLLWDPQGNPYVAFYEYNPTDTVFTAHAEWSSGLPSFFQTMRLADLDRDGVCELFGLRSDHVWECYARVGGSWQLQENVLPPNFSDRNISFADADGDGDLDLFGPGDVWINGSLAVDDDLFVLQPSVFGLSAHPNPFNPQTTIRFTLTQPGRVTLKIFDVLGREVATLLSDMRHAGSYTAAWDAGNAAAGLYFARLSGPEGARVEKLVLVK